MRVKPNNIVIVSGALLFMCIAFTTHSPSAWQRVTIGMSRSDVYAAVGRPHFNNESTKGGVGWQSDRVVGRWEFDVYFRDETVNTIARRWRWNWW
jgi:hypothetical protein